MNTWGCQSSGLLDLDGLRLHNCFQTQSKDMWTDDKGSPKHFDSSDGSWSKFLLVKTQLKKLFNISTISDIERGIWKNGLKL